jgi:hypothetical protein
MATRSFGEELTKEMTGKAIMWVPAIAGAFLLGPLGVCLGFLGSVGIMESLPSGSPPPAGGQEGPKDQRS